MTVYAVTIRRTELIRFDVEADSPEEADENVYSGEEISSRTEATETVSIIEITRRT